MDSHAGEKVGQKCSACIQKNCNCQEQSFSAWKVKVGQGVHSPQVYLFQFLLKRERFESIDLRLDIRFPCFLSRFPTKSYCELWRDEGHYTNLQSTRVLKIQHYWELVVFTSTLLSKWSKTFRLFLKKPFTVPPWLLPGHGIWWRAQELPKRTLSMTHRKELFSHYALVYCFCTLTYIFFHCHFPPTIVANNQQSERFF